MSNNIVLFLQELVQRLFQKSPTFFKVWQFVSGALVLITGVPAFLIQFNIHLPELFNAEANKVVAWASSAVLFMTLLTTQSKPTAITETGAVLKSTNEDKLPFTAKHEAIAADKVVLPTVTPTGESAPTLTK